MVKTRRGIGARLLAVLFGCALALLMNTCAGTRTPEVPDYLGDMERAAVAGDLEAGHLAEYARSRQLQERGSGEVPVSFDDLYLLARFIYAEAGGRGYSDEQRMCTGELALNRVLSPDYPDTLEAVIYQGGLSERTSTLAFKTELRPSRPCVQAAMRLLLGERMMAPEVVLRSDRAEGRVYARFCRREGFEFIVTYFCAPE